MERRQLAVREGPVWHTDLAKLLAELAPQSPVREVEDREDVPLEPRPMDGGSGPRSEGPDRMDSSGERERAFSQRGPGRGPRAAARRGRGPLGVR